MRLLFSLLSLSLLSSCALTTIHLDGYKATKERKVEKPYKVYVKVDNAPSKKVGVKKGGYGNVTASVFVDTQQSKWLKDALEKELNAHGMNVVSEKSDKTTKLVVKINQLFVEPSVGFWWTEMVGVTDLTVYAVLPNNEIYKRSFIQTSTSGEMIWTDGDYEDRFYESVQMCLQDVSVRLEELLNGEKQIALN